MSTDEPTELICRRPGRCPTTPRHPSCNLEPARFYDGANRYLTWPVEATGYYDSREAAAAAATASGYTKVRLVKVVRTMEFYDPEPTDSDGAILGAA